MEAKYETCPICGGSGLIGIKPSEGADLEDWDCWFCQEGLVDRAKLRTYEGVTALIRRANEFRKLVGRDWVFRGERDQPLVKAKNLDIVNYKPGEYPHVQNRLECCDCGLTHGLYIDEKGFLRTIPWRPRDFRYDS